MKNRTINIKVLADSNELLEIIKFLNFTPKLFILNFLKTF